jgi:hypothetical protein
MYARYIGQIRFLPFYLYSSAMAACSSAHHRLGTDVRLIRPHYVTPFVKTNKNDRNDAEAIVEAASRPIMNFASVKSVDQQDMAGGTSHARAAAPSKRPWRLSGNAPG